MRPSWIAIGTFLAVVLAAAVFFTLRISEGPPQTIPKKVAAIPPIMLVSISDHYHAGTHAISGVLALPTACTPFAATTSAVADGIRVDIASQADSGVCLQLPATTTFSVSGAGNASSSISVYVNGVLATSTAS